MTSQNEHPPKPEQHCGHECVCHAFRDMVCLYSRPFCPRQGCQHDTRRSRPVLDVLDELEVWCYSMKGIRVFSEKYDYGWKAALTQFMDKIRCLRQQQECERG
jgi:hypothetical protein